MWKDYETYRFDWINGQVLIDVEPCTCVYYERIKKFDEELGNILWPEDGVDL